MVGKPCTASRSAHCDEPGQTGRLHEGPARRIFPVMKSMTGFGRGSAVQAGLTVLAEVSSVNRKQLDIVVVLPRELADYENQVRMVVGAAVTRGRIQVKITADRTGAATRTVSADAMLLREYRLRLGELLGHEPDLTVNDILRLPGVLEVKESEPVEGAVEAALGSAIADAVAAWDRMRADEGKHLRRDIDTRLATVESALAGIDTMAPKVIDHYRRQLLARLEQAGLPVDLKDDRLVREIGLFAERCDISEERTRLHSHLEKFRGFLDQTDPPGRALDFLLQEMNREVNTIGAKANDAAIAHGVVTAKTELEKIREQVQNIE